MSLFFILGQKSKPNGKKSKRSLKRQVARLLKEKAFNSKDIVKLAMSDRVRTVLETSLRARNILNWKNVLLPIYQTIIKYFSGRFYG